jgi:hypothetical protein
MSFIRSTVKKKAGFNIKDICPIKRVDHCFIPALFVAGAEDDFIHPRHSSQIHAKYAGDKNLILVEGDHNSPRPQFMFDSAAIFLQVGVIFYIVLGLYIKMLYAHTHIHTCIRLTCRLTPLGHSQMLVRITAAILRG